MLHQNRSVRIGRAITITVLTLLSVLSLGAATAVTAPPAAAVTALVAPGTGTPDANVIPGYLENARDYYMTTTPCTVANDCNVVGVNYPASFWPIFFRPRWCVPGRCDKWDVSVAAGLNNFNSQLVDLLATTDEEIVLFGYSQGGAIVSNQLRLIAGIDPVLKERLSVVLIGNIDNPLGGPWTQLGFLGTVPIVDVTTGMPTIVDTGIPMTSVHFEYDGVGDFPLYWGNPIAFLNGLAGFWYVHGQMLWPNGYNETGLPNGYTPAELAEQMNPDLHPENFRYDSFGNPFITVPTRTLPIMQPLLDFGQALNLSWLVQPLVDLVSPALRVIIDIAYDRELDPGVPRYLSPLPFNPKLNPLTVATDFVDAIGEGVQAFLADVRGPATAPAPDPVAAIEPAPAATTSSSTRRIARSASTPAVRAAATVAETTHGARSARRDSAERTARVSRVAHPQAARVAAPR